MIRNYRYRLKGETDSCLLEVEHKYDRVDPQATPKGRKTFVKVSEEGIIIYFYIDGTLIHMENHSFEDIYVPFEEPEEEEEEELV